MTLPKTLSYKEHQIHFEESEDGYEVTVTLWLPHRSLKPFRCETDDVLLELFQRIEDQDVKRYLDRTIGPRIRN